MRSKRYDRSVLGPLLSKPWPQAQPAFAKLVAKIFAEGEPAAVFDTLASVVEEAVDEPRLRGAAERIAFEASENVDPAFLEPRWFELAERHVDRETWPALQTYLARLLLVAPHPERLERLMAFARTHPDNVAVLRVLADAGAEGVGRMALERLRRASNPYRVLGLLHIVRRFDLTPDGATLVDIALRSLPHVRDESSAKQLLALVDEHGDRDSVGGLQAAYEALRAAEVAPAVIDRVEETLESFCEVFEVPLEQVTDVEADAWPFLFYYPLPRAKVGSTWYDYEIRFESEPLGETRTRIAEAFVRAVAGSTVEVRERWRWAETWLLLPLILEPDEDEGWHDLAGPVREALKAIHALAPIAEVQCTALHDERCEHPWHRWTEMRQRTPSPAPFWGFKPDHRFVYSRQVRYEATGEEDPAVEAVLRARLS